MPLLVDEFYQFLGLQIFLYWLMCLILSLGGQDKSFLYLDMSARTGRSEISAPVPVPAGTGQPERHDSSTRPSQVDPFTCWILEL